MPPRRVLLSFLVVAFAFSGVVFALSLLLNDGDAASLRARVYLPYLLGPLAGALFVQWKAREPPLSLFGGDPFPSRWFLVAWSLGPLVGILSMFLAPLVSDAHIVHDLYEKLETWRAGMPPEKFEEARKNLEGVSRSLFFFSQLMPSVLYGATVGAAVALAEEIGWRVTLVRGLAGLRFWPTALATGLVRGLWAVPLALIGLPYDQHPRAGALVGIVYSVLTGILATYLRVRGGSVLPAALFIGGMVSAANVSDVLLLGGDDLTTRTTGLPGLIVLAVLVLVLVVPKTRAAEEALAAARAETSRSPLQPR